MKIKFTSIMRSGIDYGATYEITGSYEDFLLFIDELGCSSPMKGISDVRTLY